MTARKLLLWLVLALWLSISCVTLIKLDAASMFPGGFCGTKK